jgi:hypothetical protein
VLTFGWLGFGIIVCCLGVLFLLLFLGVITAGFFILGVLVPKVADVSSADRVWCSLRQSRAHVIAKRLLCRQDNEHVPRQRGARWESQGKRRFKAKGSCLLLFLLTVVVFREGDKLLLFLLLPLAGGHVVYVIWGRGMVVWRRNGKVGRSGKLRRDERE